MEAAAMARAIAHAWPSGRWTPPVVDGWRDSLRRLDVATAETTLARLKVSLVDPPVWAQFMAEARHHMTIVTPLDDGPPLDVDGHMAAIAALRAQHKFLNK
jgi:hypothetical protein